jgi:hypothetical protein
MQEIDAANAAAAAANGHANGNSSPQLTSKQSNIRLHQTVSIFFIIALFKD